MARKLGTRSQGRRGHPRGHGAHWSVGAALASCAHGHIIPSAQHGPGWPRAGSCSQRWHPSLLAPCPAGLALAPAWHCRGTLWGGEMGTGEEFAVS